MLIVNNTGFADQLSKNSRLLSPEHCCLDLIFTSLSSSAACQRQVEVGDIAKPVLSSLLSHFVCPPLHCKIISVNF